MIANSSLVFGKALKEELEKQGDEVTLLDFEYLYLFAKGSQDNSVAQKFAWVKGVPKLSMLFRIYYIKQVIKKGHYDVVNIHYSRWYYRWLLPLFGRIGTRLVISTYGSDFYRVSKKIRNRLRPVYAGADAVTFTNRLTKEAFVDFYKDFAYKSYVCRFGLEPLEYIDRNRKTDRAEIRRNLGYAADKIIVTCGYNATSAQQHFQIIEAIETLDKELQEKCQFVFLLTYGDDRYRQRVLETLAKVSFHYAVVEEFLYADDNAYVKLASDVMVNILETDSFSGSMQEFLYAGNVVITGEWLPYEVLDDAGIFWYKIKTPQALGSVLQKVLKGFETVKEQTTGNREIVASLSSWEKNIDCWRRVLEGEKK